ncbi:GNAT family N-acetyltransferase [Pelagicoccus mobilis]|uniref:GNAT family N-acetyltransferase n=1 Tax=Pelagicoccus mobilis TaxID=415221 RepID=A0A934VR20_9BACT|nr:GNAT family N-acetyltransferase [Pelagicoccus mobilis]MBK1877084.1 GNAT family N-acetyltransferase [Pelagicoccus mobilis]
MIETERLILRPFLESDFEGAKSVWGDRETMSFYPEPYSDERIKKAITKQIGTFEEGGYGLFALIEKESTCFVGDCGITVQDIDGAQEFEIGYHLNRSFWGRGYAVEAALAVKRYGFETLKLQKLCSYMESAHQQSRRVAEKVGMTLEKEYLNPNNRNLPTTVFSIRNGER